MTSQRPLWTLAIKNMRNGSAAVRLKIDLVSFIDTSVYTETGLKEKLLLKKKQKNVLYVWNQSETVFQKFYSFKARRQKASFETFSFPSLFQRSE